MVKIIDGDYIVAIGTGNTNGIEISQSEYDAILSVIRNHHGESGKGYRLKTDLSWEEYDLPHEDEAEVYTAEALGTMTTAELAAILATFGVSASMTKANMIRLILACQEGAL